MLHRNFYKQVRDFYFIKHKIRLQSKKWDGTSLLVEAIKSELNDKIALTKLQKTIITLLTMKPMTEFILTKFLYLVDLESFKLNNKLLTDSLYLNQMNGPFIPSLKKELESLKDYIMIKEWKNAKFMELKKSINYDKYKLNNDEMSIVLKVFDAHKNKTSSKLKTRVYLTKPMKTILKKERNGEKAYNIPIEFSIE